MVFLRPYHLPDKDRFNFYPLFINNRVADTGAATYYYFKEHPEVKIKPINMLEGDQLCCPHDHDKDTPYKVYLSRRGNSNFSIAEQIDLLQTFNYSSQEIELLKNRPCNIEFFLDGHFMHFRGIPTWTGVNKESPEFLHQIKLCQDFIKSITE